jgi:hypothetical protein
MRVYKDGDVTLEDSKFLRDGLEVSAESIIGRWPSLSPHQKLEFAHAFSAKPKITSEDERILDFLMGLEEPIIWRAIAILLHRHRDKERALAFVLARIAEDAGRTANFFQALGLMGDKRAIPALRAAYDDYRKKLGAGADASADFDYISYLSCCNALWKLEGSKECRDVLEEFTRSDEKSLRRFAEIKLRSG